jgi:hypothetical protein
MDFVHVFAGIYVMREITKTPELDGRKAGSFSVWKPSEHESTSLLLTLVRTMPYNVRPLYHNVISSEEQQD